MDIKVEVHEEDWNLNTPIGSLFSLSGETIVEVKRLKNDPEDYTEYLEPNVYEDQYQIKSEESNHFDGEPPTKKINCNNEDRIIWNMERILTHLNTHKQCIAFSESRGLIFSHKKCSRHNIPMILSNGATFRCYKGCPSISRATGTLFANLNMPMPMVFRLMYCFAINMPLYLTKRECQISLKNEVLPTSTITYWHKIFRKAIVAFYKDDGLIGGKDCVVQVNETLIGKSNEYEGVWVIGIIADDSEDLRLEVCPNDDRTVEFLIPIIKKHVKEGSIIQTDSNIIYPALNEHGEYILDETNPQRVISKCLTLKDNYNCYDLISHISLKEWLVEYTWRRCIHKLKLDEFEELMRCIEYKYQVK